jgi:hypothetical protein
MSILWIITAVALWTPPQQVPASVGTATVSGVVSDQAMDAGMGRVLVRLTGTGGAVRNAITFDDGTFRFEGLPAGRYAVTASKPGYLWMAYGALQPETPGPSIAVGEGETAGDVRIALVRTSAVSGTVRDEFGRGLPGLTVMAVPTGLRARQENAEHRAVTNQQGDYRLGGLAPGEYYVVARPSDADGRRASSRPEAEVDWLLEQLRRGVRDDFEPWPGRRTYEAPAAYGPTFYPGTQMAAAAATVTVGPAEQREPVDIAAQRLHVAAVNGVLQVPVPYDVSFAEVALVPRHAALHGIAFSTSAFPPQGFKFSFDAVPPGPYVLIAMGTQQRRAEGLVPGALWAVRDVEIPASESFDLTVSLQPSGRLAGEVTTAGSSDDVETTSWSVRLEPHAPWLAGSLVGQAAATSGDDGRFALGNLGPVQFDVAIAHAETRRQGWRPQTAEAYGSDVLDTPLTARPEIEGQMAVTVTSEDARLAGRLEVGPAFSAADFHLLVFPRDPGLRSSPNRIAAVQPAAFGDYDVRGLPDGDYLVGLLVGPPGSYTMTPELLEAIAGGSVAVTLQIGTSVRQDIQFAQGGG